MAVRRPVRAVAELAVLALIAACLTMAATPAFGSDSASPAGAPMRVTTTTSVPCAFWNQQLPTDWYLPAAAPIGLLYAQHGFAESKDDWVDFAMGAAGAGFVVFAPTLPTANLFGCTVQSTGSNTRFLTGVAALFSGVGDANGSLARSFAAAVTLAGRQELTLPSKLAIIGHSVGAESALYVASTLVGTRAAGADLRGILLADPVRSLVGGNLASALRELAGIGLSGPTPVTTEPSADGVQEELTPAVPAPTPGQEAPAANGVVGVAPTVPAGDSAAPTPPPLVAGAVPLPILVLAAPAQTCNAQQSGTRAVVRGLADRTFFGAMITTGSHADIFGRSVNKVERLTCGLPRQVNVDATRALAMAWLTDAVTGGSTSDAYPGGAGYDALISKGVITTLR